HGARRRGGPGGRERPRGAMRSPARRSELQSGRARRGRSTRRTGRCRAAHLIEFAAKSSVPSDPRGHDVRYNYDRLTAQDNSFLLFETHHLPMHVSSAMVFDAGPLRTPEGGVDIEAIRRAPEGVLHRIPRYRQKLHWIPFDRHAVWVDDPRFQLDFHLRHTALPRPGSDAQLKRLCARIMAQPLDRSRPLWETWVI